MNKIFFCVSALLLASCGFTPMLSKNISDQGSQTGARLVVESSTKDGCSYPIQMMRQRLKVILTGLNLDSTYKIHVGVSEESGSLAYAADATATRSMLRMTARIVISCSGQTVFETKLNSVTSYSQNTSDEFVNQSAAEGAKERLIESLSIDISRELQKFSALQKEKAA